MRRALVTVVLALIVLAIPALPAFAQTRAAGAEGDDHRHLRPDDDGGPELL